MESLVPQLSPTIPLFWRRFARVMRNAPVARELDPQEKEFLNDE
jgi:hypothetical protein